MPGLITTLRQVTNRPTYEGVQNHIIPRGLVYPIDFGGLGMVRFGEKEGSTFPLIRPDNRFALAEDAIFNSDQLVLKIIPKWMQPGGYITVGLRESHEIDDVNDNIVFLSTNLLADFLEGQFIYHFSNPVQVEGNYLAGQLVINIDSSHFVVRGDVIAIPKDVANIIISFDEYQIIDLNLVSFVNDVYQYQVTFDRPITRSLVDNQTIQLRAFPAYKSPVRNVPSTSGFVRRIAGPFLIDWVSAPLRNKLEVEETQTVYLYNNNRALIDEPRVVDKNDIILNNPIPPDQFLFWQKVDGSINYDNGSKKFVMIANDDGHWRLKFECVPLIQIPSKNAIGFIQCVEAVLLNNNQNFILDDTDTQVIFEYKTNSAYVPTASSNATGSITVSGIPVDNEWVRLDDGFGGVVDFEFKRTGAYTKTAGRYTLDITSAVLDTDVAVLIREFLEGITGFLIEATTLGNTVNLSHTKISTKGNQLITWSAGLGAWTFVGMSGGTNKVVTVDVTDSSITTAIEVAQLTSQLVTNENLFIKASWPALIPVIELTTTIPGSTANIPITTTVTALGWLVHGMSGGSGGFRWNVTLTPEAEALFRIRFYPNDWQDFNLPVGVPTSIAFEIAATDSPVEMIDMLIKTDPGAEALMSQWSITGARVGAIHYEYVARVQGDYNFTSTTLFLKPMFQNLSDVQAVHNAGFTLNNGYMRL